MSTEMISRGFQRIIGKLRKIRGLHINRVAHQKSRAISPAMVRKSGIRCSCPLGCKLDLRCRLRVSYGAAR
jgi:hypothetical protein